MLLLALAALAHSPHDVCPAVARAADGTLLAGETDDLARFAPDGTIAAHLPSPGDTPACLASLGPGAWALVTAEGAAWRSDDDGARWTALAPVGTVACAEADGGALLGGADGVWWVPAATGAAAEHLAEGAVTAVAEGPDGVFALDGDGALRVVGEDAPMVVHPGPWNVIAGGEALLLADGAGVAVWEEGVAKAVAGPSDVVALAVGPDAWLAAGPTGGVWWSADAGASWVEEADGLEVEATGSGSPGDGVHWSALVSAADTWVAASWEGLYTGGPFEERWSQVEIRTSPFVRALQWLDDGTLLIAPYGAGLARGTPGADDWVDAAPALGWPWLRDVLATEGGAGRWWAVGGRHLYASDDAGATWDVALTGLALVGDVIAVAPGWPDDARVWSGGVDEDGVGAVVASADGGETWAITPLAGCGDKPSALAVDGDTAWVACGSGVWSVVGEVATRVELPEPLAQGAVLALIPDARGLVVGGDGGLWRLGAEAEVLLPSKVRAAAALPEGWLVSTDRGLVRVTAAGSTPLGWPEDDLIASLAVDGERLAAGGFSGAWTSDDGGATWALATDRDRYDDADATWFYEGWDVVSHGSAKREQARFGRAGAVAEWRIEATALAVRAFGAGTLAVTVDDGPREEIEFASGRWPVVWSDAFERGIHTVRIEVLDGQVELDGGERWRADGAVPSPRGELFEGGGPAGAERPCGCGGGGAGVLVGVGLVGVGRRRRGAW